MSPADHARLRTWALEIAQTMLGEQGITQGHNVRFPGRGGFVVHRGSGAWYHHSEHRGGFSMVGMLAFLQNTVSADAETWGAAWLRNHPGNGSCTGAADDDEASTTHIAANDATAHAVLDAVIPLTDPRAGPVVTYLASRGLAPPYPETLHCLPDVWIEQLHRPGEIAMVAELYAHDTLLGAQVTWLDVFGAKSLHEPARETFFFEDQRAKAATFQIQTACSTEGAPDIVACEGVEDALSLAMANVAPLIIATLGSGRLKHVEVRRGTSVVLFRDGDAAGKATAGTDALLLQGAAVRVTDTPENADPNSLIQSGGINVLRALVDEALPAELSFNGEAQRLARMEVQVREPLLPAVAKRHGVTLTSLKKVIQAYVRLTEAGGETQATRLLRLGSDGVELFHTPEGETYADITVEDHRETWPIEGREFRRWLQHRYFEETNSAPNAEAIAAALAGLDARARFAGEELSVCLRVGAIGDQLYLDLCNTAWQVVEITAAGWRVLSASPVRFTRGAGMRELPQPAPGGSLDRLCPLLNVGDEKDFAFRLVVAWLLAGLRPNCAYPVMAIGGEAETAKSTCAKILRALLDPNRAPLRSLPKDEQDLMVSARNAHVLVFDNLSGLPSWLSDAVCRLSTGGGLGTRTLYTNAEETIFDGQRPVVLVGIAEIITQQDLASRAIFLELQPIPAQKRRTEAELLAELATAGPDILGGLLDLAVIGLRELPNTRLDAKPRMADFAVWALLVPIQYGAWAPSWRPTATTPSRSWPMHWSSDQVSAAVRSLLATVGPVAGQTAADLLTALGYQVTWEQRRSRTYWPATPRALSARLRRVAPALRKVGIEIIFTREGHDRVRRISIEQRDTRASARHADRGKLESAASAPSSERSSSTISESYSNKT